jgi:hypothetical protein
MCGRFSGHGFCPECAYRTNRSARIFPSGHPVFIKEGFAGIFGAPADTANPFVFGDERRQRLRKG